VSGMAACPSQVGRVPVVGGLPAVGRALRAGHLADWVWSGSEGECLLRSGVQESGAWVPWLEEVLNVWNVAYACWGLWIVFG